MKMLLLISGFIFMFGSSCRKGHTCTCDQSIDATGGKAIFTFNTSKEAAQAKCSQMLANPYYTNCFLQ